MTQETLVAAADAGSLKASRNIQTYFERLRKDTYFAYQIAQRARARGYDPEEEVSVAIAKTLAERVIGLISVIVPQIKNAGVEQRIEELEAEHGVLDWRVALVIALEIAQQKYCAFESDIAAITAGVRVGFAYITLGVVSAPLEGLTSIEIKDRLDGKGKYFCCNFSGPIRNAGGTAASVCVLIADYVRTHLGYATYDPTQKEMMRCPAEISDYHEYITNLQYFPSETESLFLMRHLPVEIGGDPSEKYEVANVNLKDLPRIPTNNLRSGYCLIHSSCIPLKAPKLWKALSAWGEQMGLGHWKFLKEFLDIQKKMKAAGKKQQTDVKITPDYTYIKDLVAGRPVLGYPLRSGGFRLRYGRSRVSGYSGQAIHPCTMLALDGYIASATQLKVERPGKAAAFMPCDTIEGPIVRLKNGTVLQLQDEEEAKKVLEEVEQILYLGDVLINYGDFFDRNHALVPAGYCPEWWIQEVEKVVLAAGEPWNATMLAKMTGVAEHRWEAILQDPLRSTPSAEEAIAIAHATRTPLHPSWTPYWKEILPADVLAHVLISPGGPSDTRKRTYELLGIPHKIENSAIALGEGWELVINAMFGSPDSQERKENIEAAQALIDQGMSALEIVQHLSDLKIRDKSGTFIGARMGRPEKSKMRKLTGSPHCLFPVGDEGGRLRSFQEALTRGKINAEFPLRYCKNCEKESVFGRCIECDHKTEQRVKQITRYSGEVLEVTSAKQEIPIREIFNACMKKITSENLSTKNYPDLIKGVRGTSNKSHIPEHLIKGILRAKSEITVNKDGTTRYDSSEVACTHFKPREVGVKVDRLRDLGYTHDVHGVELFSDDQILELKPQDVIIPCCEKSPDDPADVVFLKIAQFIDDELELLYGLEPYYRLENRDGLVGQYIVGLAPHTSAGIVGRIIGFSNTQGFLAHPFFHAAMRRDCDGDESCFILLMDVLLNFSAKFLPETRGSTMDAPLVITYLLNPAEVDDMAFHVDRAWRYPAEMYEAALEYKKPYDVKVELIADVLGTEAQFEGMGFTHDTTNFNSGVTCSAYKTIPSMTEKMAGQMILAKKIRACDASDVARLVIEKHFIRDIKGNLRKFTQQEWRCVNCNEKFRRPPLVGKCTQCGGKILFTIAQGSVIKYLQPSLTLAEEYQVPVYLQDDLKLLARKIDDLFGREKEKQTGLGQWGVA